MKAGWLPGLAVVAFASAAQAQGCVECHKKQTPGIVNDWQISMHAENSVGCEGDEMIRQADHLMAQAIRIMAGRLQRDAA